MHHSIYITLKDKNPAAVEKQLELGKKYLNDHPGELSFFATVVAHDLTRHKQVSYLFNEDDFDVAFHMVFADRQAHDTYQISDAHVNHFIPQSNLNWVKIRVFDSVEI
ncbi:Dabb family protein [Phyllobacterium salinisoli]|uniref:Dabb family protein n=1 Tax=Phyllobacterium salinisoli TaxID=1899321 RepID=A0A368K7X3_9HYPH|nr:Dabb family protein [Phyllobacterium salinisoli]